MYKQTHIKHSKQIADTIPTQVTLKSMVISRVRVVRKTHRLSDIGKFNFGYVCIMLIRIVTYLWSKAIKCRIEITLFWPSSLGNIWLGGTAIVMYKSFSATSRIIGDDWIFQSLPK